ncbi:hypothetical protein PIIN_06026 [Serendipita indica DSM 11827]|uniref:Uncharacterized protein n=1 Tax=Serendipita indica (strain DSM 11827) TaxID=1109443 RepID=G4TL95_SERID|nr:hypothetical protein PIIN_06026 [Serendipita indica DSM 11827]
MMLPEGDEATPPGTPSVNEILYQLLQAMLQIMEAMKKIVELMDRNREVSDLIAKYLVWVLKQHAIQAARDVSEMPDADSARAPFFSEGQNPKLLPAFFTDLEYLFKDSQITSDSIKLRYLLRYLSPNLRETVRQGAGYAAKSYDGAKEELLKAFGNPKAIRYTEEDLDACVKEYSQRSIKTIEDFHARHIRFNLISRELRKIGVSEQALDRAYVKIMPFELREKILGA